MLLKDIGFHEVNTHITESFSFIKSAKESMYLFKSLLNHLGQLPLKDKVNAHP